MKQNVIVSLVRGINVGGKTLIRMEALKGLYESAGVQNPVTYIQSGNVIYRTSQKDTRKIAAKVEAAIESSHGFRPPIIQRTLPEFRALIAANPFPAAALDPSKLLVTFLADEPSSEAGAALRSAHAGPEQMHLVGSELFIYFPDGMGRSKLSPTLIDRKLRISGTGRNWNTVLKLLQLAESLEQA